MRSYGGLAKPRGLTLRGLSPLLQSLPETKKTAKAVIFIQGAITRLQKLWRAARSHR